MTYPYGNDGDGQQNPGGWNQQPNYGGQQPNMGGYGYGNQPGQGPKPNNYLVWSILTTLFCCVPGGIVSIVYAVQVDKHWNQGNQQAAQDSADKAKLWAIISAVAGGVLVGISIAYYAYIAATYGSYYY